MNAYDTISRYPVDKSLSATSTWTDIDLSANVPATATGAIFQVINTDNNYHQFGLQKNGSSDNRHADINPNSQHWIVIGVDANRKCEGYIENTSADFHLVGYLTMGEALTDD